MKTVLPLVALAFLSSTAALATPVDLTGGVFIHHAPPLNAYSPPEDLCDPDFWPPAGGCAGQINTIEGDDSGVPATGEYCGAPSKLGVNFGPLTRLTVAVCGIEFSITASCACGVPATVGSTAEASEPGGMRAKSGGSALLAM